MKRWIGENWVALAFLFWIIAWVSVAFAQVATTQYPGVVIAASAVTKDEVTLTWKTASASACFASWGNVWPMISVPLQGSATVKITTDTLFTVSCAGTAAMLIADGSPNPPSGVNQPASIFVTMTVIPNSPAELTVH